MELNKVDHTNCIYIPPRPHPLDDDHCDCDERCDKCGKKKRKKWEIGPIWCKDDHTINKDHTYTLSFNIN